MAELADLPNGFIYVLDDDDQPFLVDDDGAFIVLQGVRLGCVAITDGPRIELVAVDGHRNGLAIQDSDRIGLTASDRAISGVKVTDQSRYPLTINDESCCCG